MEDKEAVKRGKAPGISRSWPIRPDAGHDPTWLRSGLSWLQQPLGEEPGCCRFRKRMEIGRPIG